MLSIPTQTGKRIALVALGAACILLIPLIAMQFTDEVQWDLFDFIVMGALLFGSGLIYVLFSGMSENRAYRAAVGIAVAATLILIWMNLAVGLIGSEDNPANALYAGVVFIGLIGAAVARFRPQGMARASFAMASAQFLVPIIAMIIWRPSLDDVPGIVGVFMLNTFFVGLFFVSGLLFRHAGKTDLT